MGEKLINWINSLNKYTFLSVVSSDSVPVMKCDEITFPKHLQVIWIVEFFLCVFKNG